MRMLPIVAASSLILSLLWAAALPAESYQPKSNVTRGIYADIGRALQLAVWDKFGEGYTFVDQQPHSGRSCLRCEAKTGLRGQGVGQQVEFNQTEPRPIKIAGWSRAAKVAGKKGYHYSLYVDFVFTDGQPWYMRLATFEPGTHDWQYAETVVTPPKPVARARFSAFLRETEGCAWFDDLFFGEVNGPNLLRSPGFEESDRYDRSQRDKLLADLAMLHCNALHSYLSAGLDAWNEPPSADSPLAQFLSATRQHGIGVWLTLGMGLPSIRDASDPNFPQYYCVNGPWGKRWTEALVKAACYPFAGLSMVPDEYNWNNAHLHEQFDKHADPKVREFYSRLRAYCDCPACQAKFASQYGGKWPESLPGILTSADLSYRRWLRFRYDSTTEWLGRSCQAVKKANPAIRTDSLICVTPLCSDFWYGPGIAWDRAGYEAGLEYATTDPYIQLHNYLGDSTHWYVTETTEHLAAASPKRRAGVVLEASRLRKEHRESDPVEIYGSALSAVWHGADELAWWHHGHVMDIYHTTGRPEVSQAAVRGAYGLLERIDGWLDGITPEPGVALLFSRASCDLWRLYASAADVKPPFDTRGIKDPRHASLVQKELLYLLLRTGVPTTVYYLDSVRKEELANHRVILVPFPLAVSAAKAKLLEELARAGKRIVIFETDGPIDEEGTRHARPVLADLVKKGQATKTVVALPPGTLERIPANRDNEKRTHRQRIMPSPLNAEVARSVLNAVTGPAASRLAVPLLAGRLPEGDDVELCVSVNARGERLLLAINWNSDPRAVTLPKGCSFDRPAAEIYRLGSDGRWAAWNGSLQDELRLEPQEVLVARFERIKPPAK